ncbi:MAG TPA: VWA domain-containing protein [Candidatus Angelobacter sp.]
MTRLFKRFGFLTFVIVSIAAIGTDRQQPAAAPSPTPAPQGASAAQGADKKAQVFESATVLKATTRLVVVDVVATGKNGEAVTDLERPDFRVSEDGKEQTIRVFSFQQPKSPPPGQADTTAAVARASFKLPDNVFSNAPRYNPESALNVVLMDGLNTTTPHQAYVRDQMIKFLGKMPQGRPVAVYTLGSKLTLLQDFTSDPETLREVVKKLKGNSSALLDNPSGGPDQELLPAGEVDSGLVSAAMLQSMMQFEQERTSFLTDLRVTYTLNALNAIARSLSGYPGRKNLIWVSEAFPISIDPNMELTGDIFAGTRNYGPQIAAAADNLIDAQVAIYPVDARGLEPNSMFDAANTGRDKYGRSMNGPRMGTAISNENAQLQNVHGTMNDMADRTGGKAFYNRNDIGNAIGKSIEDGSTYYTLAYYPENKNWNGKFRKIQVKVNRSGVKLRYRLGYYAVDPKIFAEQNKNQQANLFGEALNPDSPMATGLRFDAGVIQPSPQTENKVLVNFALDPHAISFDYQADGLQHAQVDCVVQAYSSKRKLIKTEASTINASLKPDTYNKILRSVFPCQQFIALPPGSYYLRLGVRDDRTGLMGTTNGRVTVAETPAATEPQSEEKKP